MKTTVMMLMALSVVVLAGCNTLRGFGQDMEKAGTAIQKKSDR